MKKKLQILGEYFGHLLLGAMMYIGLATVGGLLTKFNHWLASFVDDQYFVLLMNLVEKTILYGDIFFIVWVVIYSTYKAVKELLK